MKPQIKLATLALAFLSTLNAQLSTARAQGSLTPPGAPAPTMKTLAQIEPRTPITNTGALTISVAGAYYLTTNLTVSSGDAITINADNVTLDLNGFTIFSTAPSANGTAILLNNGRANIAIYNGHIQSGVTNNSSGVFSGSGFNDGIYGSSSLPIIKNVRVANVSVEGCLSSGIFLGGLIGTVVESCTVNIAGSYGIGADTILNSTAIACGNTAIAAVVASSCRGSSINGIGVSATTAQNCYGTTTGPSNGISANTADNCRGEISVAGGWGLFANVAQNCQGSGQGDSYGVLAGFSANNCYGVSVSGYGLRVANIFTGAGGTATGCRGASTSGTGLSATVAQNCYGVSTSGNGMFAEKVAQNCYGSGSGAGISLSSNSPGGGIANNCFGICTTSGNGIVARIAIGCYGQSPNGYGISAFIANSCDGVGTPIGVGATHKYNMP